MTKIKTTKNVTRPVLIFFKNLNLNLIRNSFSDLVNSLHYLAYFWRFNQLCALWHSDHDEREAKPFSGLSEPGGISNIVGIICPHRSVNSILTVWGGRLCTPHFYRPKNLESNLCYPQFFQKNEKNRPQVEFFCSFFGRIEDTIICFQDLLTFNDVNKDLLKAKVQSDALSM